jgi:hypothetical protein
VSGALATGAFVSGALVSGALATGAFVSGALVSGTFVSGALVSLGAVFFTRTHRSFPFDFVQRYDEVAVLATRPDFVHEAPDLTLAASAAGAMNESPRNEAEIAATATERTRTDRSAGAVLVDGDVCVFTPSPYGRGSQ